MRGEISVVRSTIKPRSIIPGNPLILSKVTDSAVQSLSRIGISFSRQFVMDQIRNLGEMGAFNGSGNGMDAAFVAPITSPSIPTPIQFLQMWLPGFVKIMTADRAIDRLIGIKTIGSWEDEEIVQSIVEPSGMPTEYGDFSNIPFVNWNTNFERRTIVRGELGLLVGMLEEGRAAKMRLNSADIKRNQCAISLEIMRNAIGFFGWNSANQRTFGLLNDPQLLPFITTSITGGGGWASATFQEITADIRIMVRQLRIQSQNNIDANKVNTTLALPMTVVDYLSTTTDFGISVSDWIEQTYPKMRIESCPEFSGAHPTDDDNICMLYAEEVDSSLDGSTDGGEVFIQMVQTKYTTLGVEKKAKSYIEDYANGTAGVMCKRPYAVVRMYGI
jgi:hypothetical protein